MTSRQSEWCVKIESCRAIDEVGLSHAQNMPFENLFNKCGFPNFFQLNQTTLFIHFTKCLKDVFILFKRMNYFY